jgi:hypothetical protein
VLAEEEGVFFKIGAYPSLSHTHQGKDSGEAEEQCGYPRREERREDPRFSEGEKDVEENPVGETNHYTDPDVQGNPPGSTGLEGKRNADKDHDQIQNGVREFGIKIDKISSCIVACGLDPLDIGSEFRITHLS